MTTEEFYSTLEKKTKRRKAKWGTDFIGMLRTANCHCPLSFVAGVTACDIDAAREKLGLLGKTAQTIAAAADNYGPERHRSRLLRACGLEG